MTDLTLQRLCIHQVTLMQCDFRQSVECLARHGVSSTAVWREKLEAVGEKTARQILDDHGVNVQSLCPGGFLTGRTDAERRAAVSDNERWLEQAATLGAMSMVVITGGLDEGDTDVESARSRAIDALAELVPTARATGVKLAFEPLHPMICGSRSVVSTLQQANDILDRIDAPDVLGIALDTYALWWDPTLAEQINRANDRIINLHVSDWLKNTTSIRFDRGMPGDGHIDNRKIRQWVEKTGFVGPSEVEIFSEDNWWKRDADDVVTTIIDRLTCL